MPRITRRYRQQVFGLFQSAITCAVATLIATPKGMNLGAFALHWSGAWLMAWLSLVPVVLLAAPWIRRLTDLIVQDEVA
ncbi:DUF2798 domain-containing protein [Pseudomonas sp. BN102]|uniref:DUF2798 domain-containing protein n=1 Tax=Pseudomonas sp. BN102 TaxID=2567886 RepID=UPI002455E913|nr:DUF2798 domain-containing protein [Pseudomonas sp. BN102]MDH4612421.1 DUF2798 domain-containing protein [Pseudomonas sp. BN102]